ncbi:murein transglycosylase [Actinoplanes sp. NPDC026623]|uniref:lytic transglycosylase domain-containing protein n=1 Tax=Actinoplanes sp. NPDC026623 TaxID=3155610 RepID=UPI0034039538
MADGQDTPSARRGQRPPAPHLDGPLGSSGAAPGDEPSTTGGVDNPVTKTTGGEATVTAPDQADGAGPDEAPAATAGNGEDESAQKKTDPNKAAVVPEKPSAEKPNPEKASSEKDGSEMAGSEMAGSEKASSEKASSEKASSEKASSEKASSEKASSEKASADKAESGKASADKAGSEKAESGKASAEKASAEKASAEKDGQGTTASEKASAEKDGSKKDGSKKDGQEKTTASEKDSTEKDGKDGPGERAGDKAGKESAAPSAAAVTAASRGRATKVLRAANPVRVARKTARTTSAWAKRPSGRLILPAIIAVLLLGAAGTAGAYLVPQALQSVPSPSVTPGFGQDAGASAGPVLAPSISGVPALPGSTTAPAVGGTLPPAAPVGGVGGARPADVLATWAQQTGTRAGIPVVAVQAYGYAELVVARATPACHLTWTTIAALAKVESSHGSHNGAVLNADGSVSPAILGLPLDGKGGRQLITDTDHGTLDGDSQFDRAMGPLQFIPQTWTAISVGNAVDADNNGFSDPNDIDDASLAAARYLCQGGRDLSKPDAWWDAILSYNAVRPYAQKVFDAANEYGQRSRM